MLQVHRLQWFYVKRYRPRKRLLCKLITCLKLNVVVYGTFQQSIVSFIWEFLEAPLSFSCNQPLSEMEGLKHISCFCGWVTSIPVNVPKIHRGHSTFRMTSHSSQEPEEESAGCYLAGINIVFGFALEAKSLWCQGSGRMV